MDMNAKKNIKIDMVLTFGSLFVLGMLFILKGTILYETPDDQYIMAFLSGKFLGYPDPHAVYIKYPLAYFITQMYRGFPGIDWYATTMMIVQLLSIGWILRYLLRKQDSLVHKLICMGIFYSVFLTCWINDLLSFTYTTTAAMAAVAGVIIYGLGEDRIRDFVGVVFFCVIAYNLRSAIFLMILPICGILWMDKVIAKKQVKKQCILVGVLVIGIAGSWCGDRIAYGGGDWQNYIAYNEARTELYDYHQDVFEDYGSYQDKYDQLGLTKTDSEIYVSKNLAIRDSELFDKIEDLAGIAVEPVSIKMRLKSAVGKILKNGFLENKTMTLISGIMWMIAIGLSLVYKDKRIFVLEIVFLAMHVILWLYLGYMGRILTRVAHSMLLLQMATAVICQYEAMAKIEKMKYLKVIYAGEILVSIMLAVVAYQSASKINHMNQAKISSQAYNQVEQYCSEHSENFYFADVASLAGCSYQYQFFNKNEYANFLFLGDWFANSPLYTEKLRNESISSVRDAILNNENVYVIAKETENLEYMKSISRENASLVEIEQLAIGEGYGIYQLVVGE